MRLDDYDERDDSKRVWLSVGELDALVILGGLGRLARRLWAPIGLRARAVASLWPVWRDYYRDLEGEPLGEHVRAALHLTWLFVDILLWPEVVPDEEH